MSKVKAHVILILADILAIIAIWWGYRQIHDLLTGISFSVDAVSFTNRIGFAFVGILLPFAQVNALFEHLWPAKVYRRTRYLIFTTIVLGIVIFFGAVSISFYMQKYTEEAGYQYCSGASGVSALARTLVYTRNSEICSKATAERRTQLGLLPKQVNR